MCSHFTVVSAAAAPTANDNPTAASSSLFNNPMASSSAVQQRYFLKMTGLSEVRNLFFDRSPHELNLSGPPLSCRSRADRRPVGGRRRRQGQATRLNQTVVIGYPTPSACDRSL